MSRLRRRHILVGKAIRLSVAAATFPLWWAIALVFYVRMLSKARDDRREARDRRGVPPSVRERTEE